MRVAYVESEPEADGDEGRCDISDAGLLFWTVVESTLWNGTGEERVGENGPSPEWAMDFGG